MTRRRSILHAARVAGEVLRDAKAQERVLNLGYTRVDPVGLAEGAGVSVMVRPLDRLLGAFLREGAPGILLNIQRPIGLLHMTCAHELGHFHLGHDTTTDEMIEYRSDASVFELEADQFAYALMTPAWLLAHVLKARRWSGPAIQSPQVIYQLSLRLGISYTATVWSLHRRNILTMPAAQRLSRFTPGQLKRQISSGLGEVAADSDVWLLSPQDRGAVLEPRPNDRFIVEVPNHLTAGYLWTLDEALSEGYTMKPIASAPPEVPSGADAVVGGAARTSQYVLEVSDQAVSNSTAPAPVALREMQPWRGAQPADAGFSLRTQFEHVRSGLAEASRGRLISEAAQS